MIRIIARQVVKLECLPLYHRLAEELVLATRKEDGCLAYTLEQSVKDERVHCFVEEWRDQEAIDAHGASKHFRDIVPRFAELFDAGEMVDFYVTLY